MELFNLSLKQILVIIFLFGVITLLVNCSNKNTANLGNEQEGDQAKLIADILGPGSKILANQSNTLFLGLHIKDSFTHFVVVDTEENIILSKDKVRGSVTWNDDYSLKVHHQPGVLEDKTSNPEEQIEIIQLKVSM